MTFLTFCDQLEKIQVVSARLEMTRLLADLFARLNDEEIEHAVWMTLGRLVPKFESLEFQVAEKMMIRALSEVVVNDLSQTSVNDSADLFGSVDQTSKIKTAFSHMGDLGAVAESITSEKKDARELLDVYRALENIAKESGEGSQERKQHLLIALLRESAPLSAKYITRIVLGTLRLGFSDMTIIDAFSWMLTGDKSLRDELEDAYQRNTDLGKMARALKKEGIEGTRRINVELGVPLFPALCQRLKTAEEMIEKMGTVITEPKYDGTRVMIHIRKAGKNWKVRTFTRNLEESSGMFPELLNEQALNDIRAEEVILDSEAVGYDSVTGALLPFQQTITRKRKHDIAEVSLQVPLRFFVFDVLDLNGKSLLKVPLDERKKILDTVVRDGSVFVKAPVEIVSSPERLRELHTAYLEQGLEGVVIKQLHSEYQPGRKGFSWVKFKEEEGASGKLSDTIDAIVMGYYVGQGKRTGFGIGAFLVGIFD